MNAKSMISNSEIIKLINFFSLSSKALKEMVIINKVTIIKINRNSTMLYRKKIERAVIL